MDIDFPSLFAGISITAIGSWAGSFFALRKDERAVEIEQITKERTIWREKIRSLSIEVISAYYKKDSLEKDVIPVIRISLVTALNPRCKYDKEIIEHFDCLFYGKATDINVFSKRIALLLKHDWERVKWECTPIYKKALKLCSEREWKTKDFRDVNK